MYVCIYNYMYVCMYIYIYIYIYICMYAGPSLADAGPGARYGVGAPLGPFAMALRGGGGGLFDPFVAGGGPVRPHQLHRQKTALM